MPALCGSSSSLCFRPLITIAPTASASTSWRRWRPCIPQFLRFPGGNYLEGDHIKERFDWKKTIGPLVDRPAHRSPWNYWSTDGMGLLEFLGWCEDLHMQPVLAVYAGYSLARRARQPRR